jgi:hypothetical protein
VNGRRVAIVGVGYSAVGRNTGLSERHHAAQAALAALDDAGLSVADVDGVTTWGGDAIAFAHMLGITPVRWYLNISVAPAFVTPAVHAAMAVSEGHADVCMAWRIMMQQPSSATLSAGGPSRVLGSAQVRAGLDASLALVALTTSPPDPRAAALVGRRVASGFRAAVDEAMRRRRLVEVRDGSPCSLYAMFRDTHVDPSDAETVLRENAVTADLDPDTLVLSRCQAEPRVLPWVECPEAAASATRLDGRLASDVRRLVGRELRGTTTCTHLNDLLRSLGDLGVLAAVLRA